MKLLLILFSLGSIWALQHPVEYQYRYEGRLATGIPAIRPQVAALGIRARLTLQMREKNQAVAKLDDVEVGDFNDDLQCVQLRAPVPIQFSPMPDQFKELIEQPFAVFFQEDSRQVMKVPRRDVEFITNIRKSVVEMLKLHPVISNLGGVEGDQLAKYVSGGKAPDAFNIEEDSILGRCEHQYTITRLSHQEEEEEKEVLRTQIKDDEQSEESPRSASSDIPKIQDVYYRLVRAINFENCHERVIQQHSGGANMSHLGHSQFRSVQSRSSVSTYILKGHPGSFRVERGMVEGDVIANPFGFKTHRLQAITNQSLALEHAKRITTPIRLPDQLRPVRSWKYEVASPFKEPEGHPKEWVNYHNKGDKYYPVSLLSTLGLPPTPQQLKQQKRNFLDLLKKVEEEIHAEPASPRNPDPSRRCTKSSIATTLLERMTKAMKHLTHETVKEIFEETFNQQDVHAKRRQIILVDLAAASGAAAPIKVLLEKMKNEKISHARIASVFMTLPNNLFAPSIIPDLLEYAKSLNIEEHPLHTSSALVNIASLAEHVCLNPKKFNYSVPNAVFGNEDCKPSLITNDFLPFLERKAESARKSWEREIYLQAVANLGTPKIIKVLRPYVFGKHDATLNVRRVAIYGLSKKRLPDSARDKVFDTLMTVVENKEDRDDVRQAAMSSLLTWQPNAAWWQRMARLTWREPSQSMAAFIAFTIDSLAKSTEPRDRKQATIAAFALPLMKPYSPSLKYSYNRIFNRYDPHSKIGVDTVFSMIKSPHKSSPSELYQSVKHNFGDLKLELFEIALGSENLHKQVQEILSSLLSSSSVRRPLNLRSSEARHEQADEADMERYHSDEDRETSVYLRAFKNLYQYIPINQEVVKKVIGKGGQDLLRKLKEGKQVSMTKFLNPIDLEYFLPTEIGLPLVGSVVMPTMNVGEAHVELVDENQQSSETIHQLLREKQFSLRFKSNYKYMSKLIVKMSVPTPWNRRVIEAGVENYDELNLPVYGNLIVHHTDEIVNVTLDISSHTEHKFPVLHGHNIPFTQIRRLDVQDEKSIVSSHIIAVRKDREPVLKVQRRFNQSYSGLAAELDFYGDTPYPFTTAFLHDYLRKPAIMGKLLASPETKQWQYTLNFDPSSSDTRNISLAFSYMNLTSSRNQGRSSENIPDLSPEDDQSQRVEKLRSLSEGSKVYAVNAQLFLKGNDIRRYETVAAITKRQEDDQQNKKHKVLVAALAENLPDTRGPQALCSQAELDTPAIKTFEDLKRAIDSNPSEELRSKVYYGRSCASDSIASLRGSLKLSTERQKILQEEVRRICNYDPHNPVVELQTAAVYDKANLEIEYVKSKVPRTLLNLTYSLRDDIDGFLYPHGFHDNMHHGQDNKITIDAERPLSSRGYTFWVEMPQRRSIYTDIHVPYVATRVVPWHGLKNPEVSIGNTVILTPAMAGQCIIDPVNGKIKSYDGLRFKYDPLACFTTLSIDHRTPDLFYARTHLNGTRKMMEIELKVDSPYLKTTVRFSSRQAWINEELVSYDLDKKVISDSRNRQVIILQRGIKPEAYYSAILVGNFTAQVTDDSVDMLSYKNVHGHLRGLCGDADGNPKNDKTGPKECLYTDDNLFKYSWTKEEGKGCDSQEFEKMEKQVEQFQQNCPHRDSQIRSDIKSFYEKKSEDCYELVYPVEDQGTQVCVAAFQTAKICAKDCRSHQKQKEKLEAKCYKKDKLPEELKEALKIGYVTEPVKYPGFKPGQIKFNQDIDCRRK